MTPAEIGRVARRLALSQATLAAFTPAERSLVATAADRAAGTWVLRDYIDLSRIAADPRKPFAVRVRAAQRLSELRAAAIEGLPDAVAALPLELLPSSGERGRKARKELVARVRRLTAADRRTLLHFDSVLGDLN